MDYLLFDFVSILLLIFMNLNIRITLKYAWNMVYSACLHEHLMANRDARVL